MTYAEFGRRVQENGSNGTDHGMANAHFILGGRVKGGLYRSAPQLDRLTAGTDGGNLVHAVDFRSLYAMVLDRWWGVESSAVLGRRFERFDVLKT